MKKILALSLIVLCILSIVGCSFHSSITYTFKIDNGDQISVQLNTLNGYSLTSKVPFAILKDKETISAGKFLHEEGFQLYQDIVESSEDATILSRGEKDGNEYIFWSIDGEYNYVIKVKNSQTVILLGNCISEESAKEAFNRLTFSAVN